MTTIKTLEVPVRGMDCAECTRHVEHAIASLPGVDHVDVFLASEKAVIRLDPAQVDLPAIRQAVASAGYSVPDQETSLAGRNQQAENIARPVLLLLGVLFAVVLFVVIAGEWLGLFESITALVPWPVWLVIVIVAGYPVFRSVLRAALKGQVIAHTLMTLGVIAAAVVGEWPTAVMIVFFMRVGDYVERFTTERARRALKDLVSSAPQTARLERDGEEVVLPIEQVQVGDIVVVRPGDQIPVDGEVIAGQATIDQSTITGESMPVEVGPGAHVFAATLARLGSLRVRVADVGQDTTFGRVIRLVEEAETQKAPVERVADKFSAYYLPVVAGVAALTFIISRDPLATAAVLVVACSCAFALATPIAMLASIGFAARHGLLIKGGKYLELLSRADVVLIDKTGTLTLGRPELTDIVALSQPGLQRDHLLSLAASAEKYSEHPLAEAVRDAARQRGMALSEPQEFKALPGLGVSAVVNEQKIQVGNRRMHLEQVAGLAAPGELVSRADKLEQQGKTLLFVAVDGQLVGLLAAADTTRPEVPLAIDELLLLGVQSIELLTGDNERVAADLAESLGIACRAGLLPQDKITIVKEYQARNHKVVMVGDGVNDAPALVQANVGIAMGAAGSDIAIEAAHIALLREDWRLVPEAFRIARRTMRVVRLNIAFTAVYNLLGLSLAAFGLLPPVLAAAAQSIPDLVILGNSARLIRQK